MADLGKKLEQLSLNKSNPLSAEVTNKGVFKIANIEEIRNIDAEDIPSVFIGSVNEIFQGYSEDVLSELNKLDIEVLLTIRASAVTEYCLTRGLNRTPINRQKVSRPKIVRDIFVLGWSLANLNDHKDIDSVFRKTDTDIQLLSSKDIDPVVLHELNDSNGKQSGLSDSLTNSPEYRLLDASLVTPNGTPPRQSVACNTEVSPSRPHSLGSDHDVYDAIKQLSSQVSVIVSTTSEISNGQKTMFDRLLKLEDSLTDVSKFCRTNQHSINSLQNRVQRLEEQQGEIPTDVTLKLNAFAAAELTIRQGQLDLNQSLDALRRSVSDTENKVRDIASEQASVKEGFDRVLLDSKSVTPFNPDYTAVVTGLDKIPDEDPSSLREICEKLVEVVAPQLSGEVQDVKRVGDVAGRRGIVKIFFVSCEAKKELLRGRRKLINSEFSKVFVRTSFTHEGHLIDQNFRTLLSNLPDLQNTVRVDAKGKLIPVRSYNSYGSRNSMQGVNPPQPERINSYRSQASTSGYQGQSQYAPQPPRPAHRMQQPTSQMAQAPDWNLPGPANWRSAQYSANNTVSQPQPNQLNPYQLSAAQFPPLPYS